ncbi:MAG: Sau3AI family type II restriction endonuclease [Dysgonamonadaceae bacterium]|nr:Sau3AI family type II restriction endonuclease [Dysgonamonadaceae bacterium]
MSKIYETKEEIFNKALLFMEKCLLDVMDQEDVLEVKSEIERNGRNRKGYLGQLVQKYVFDQELVDNRAEADFKVAGVELKTTPIKEHKTKRYIAKERLVFSMIDYMTIIAENWEESSFLEKNKLILLLFYLYKKELGILDYKFKFCYELDFLNNISNKDAVQIKKDWEYIVDKIKKGEAHLLSEGDTFYLGACTKASDSSVRRQQPNSEIPAKPRAFSLKQSYLNYIIQNEILSTHEDYKSISEENKTIDEKIKDKLERFIGKTDNEIIEELGLVINKKQKQYKRTLANFMISGSNSKIEEFEKANVKLRVITLENNGNLKESISFPHFDYREIVNQDWEHSDLYRLFEEKRFLFVIFKKDKEGKSISFQGWKFWNFPAFDMEEAQRIWELNKEMIQSGKYDSLPKVSDSKIVHVRPHGRNREDKIETPHGTMETKKCFWIHANYIKESLGL